MDLKVTAKCQADIDAFVISDLKGLDPISVYLEDLEPSKGSIMVRCYDRAWFAYWGGMGGRTIEEFLKSCNVDYIAKNLARNDSSELNQTVVDYDALQGLVKEKLRKADTAYLQKEWPCISELKEANPELYGVSIDEDSCMHCDEINDLLCATIGADWCYDLPQMPNPDYEYLCKIIGAVKEALNTRVRFARRRTIKGES